jgi:hypothetical protein
LTSLVVPLVLAHGIARFDFLRQVFMDKLNVSDQKAGDAFHYFKGIKSHLEAHGFEVHHTHVDFAGSVRTRAAQLGEQINQILAGRPSTKQKSTSSPTAWAGWTRAT